MKKDDLHLGWSTVIMRKVDDKDNFQVVDTIHDSDCEILSPVWQDKVCKIIHMYGASNIKVLREITLKYSCYLEMHE